MTKLQIDGLYMGEAEAWGHDHPSPHSEENAIGYRINGLPSPLSAKIVGVRNWDVYVFRGSEPLRHPKSPYSSKEEAFVGLKDWLGKAEVN